MTDADAPFPAERRTRLAVAVLLAALAAAPAVAQPLSVEDAVGLALSQNPDVRAAAERIGEAEARLGEATSAFYPRVDGRIGFARTDNPAQAFAMILNQRKFNFDLNFNNPGPTQDVRPEIVGAFPIFRGGQDYLRRQAAELGVETAKLERLAVRNALTEAVIDAFYALVAAPQLADSAGASVRAVNTALDHARTGFDAGTVLKSDVLSLETRLAEAREGQLRATNAIELARTGLRTLLGQPAGQPLEITPPVGDTTPTLPDTADAAVTRATAARPEVGAAASQVAMREREVKAERAAYLPTIDIVGGYGNDSSDFQLSHNTDSWLVGATAELNIFSGFRTREKVRAAESQLAQAREVERRTRLEVEREAQNAFLSYGEARQRDAVSQSGLAAAEAALRLVEEQYRAGTVTVTRYLEAEAARSAAQSRAIVARYDVRRADAALQKAIGAWADDEGLTP
ncbi:MAG TPA: TolC family protein [Candidatus Dormibacteraeota bacterium]|nr:TolC family protein [Candidatus Dormibacteraeota bacterium]